jgi:hypothetical protein
VADGPSRNAPYRTTMAILPARHRQIFFVLSVSVSAASIGRSHKSHIVYIAIARRTCPAEIAPSRDGRAARPIFTCRYMDGCVRISIIIVVASDDTVVWPRSLPRLSIVNLRHNVLSVPPWNDIRAVPSISLFQPRPAYQSLTSLTMDWRSRMRQPYRPTGMRYIGT